MDVRHRYIKMLFKIALHGSQEGPRITRADALPLGFMPSLSLQVPPCFGSSHSLLIGLTHHTEASANRDFALFVYVLQ